MVYALFDGHYLCHLRLGLYPLGLVDHGLHRQRLQVDLLRPQLRRLPTRPQTQQCLKTLKE